MVKETEKSPPGDTSSVFQPLADNPYDTASWWELFVFKWPEGLLSLGATTVLEHEHLPPNPRGESSSRLMGKFLAAWREEKKKAEPWIVRAFYYTFVEEFGWIGTLGIIETFLKVYQAALLGYLIGWITDDPGGGYLSNGYTLAGLISLTGILNLILHHHFFMYVWRLGMQFRVSVIAVIYNKAIKLDLRALSRTATAELAPNAAAIAAI